MTAHVDLRSDYERGIRSCLRIVALAAPEKRLQVFGNMASESFGYAWKAGFDPQELVDKFEDLAISTGLIEEHGIDAVQATLAKAASGPPAPISPSTASTSNSGKVRAIDVVEFLNSDFLRDEHFSHRGCPNRVSR